MWKRNAQLFASSVDRLVEAGGIDFVLVTGDPHVVDLISAALSADSRKILATLAHDTVAPGASDRGLDQRIADEIATTREARLGLAIDALLTQDSVYARTGSTLDCADLRVGTYRDPGCRRAGSRGDPVGQRVVVRRGGNVAGWRRRRLAHPLGA